MSAADDYKVWIGCLGCYNGGALAGEWFDAESIPDGMKEWTDFIVNHGGIRMSHFTDGHEELWVMDHEGGIRTGEYGVMDAQAEALLLGDMHEDEVEMLKAYIELRSPDKVDEDTLEEARDSYQGEYGSDADFAENLADELGLIPTDNAWPARCIDWEQAARELMMDYSEHNGHYFRS